MSEGPTFFRLNNIHCMYILHFVYESIPSSEGPVGCFYLSVTENNVAMDVDVHVAVGVLAFDPSACQGECENCLSPC